MKTKLKIVIEYEADPEDYDTEDPKKMAEIDESNFREDPPSLMEMLCDLEDIKVKVEPA